MAESPNGAGFTSPPGLGPWLAGAVAEHRRFPDEAVDGTIAGRLFQMVDEHSDRVALSGPFGRWTYAEFGDRVRAFAQALQRRLESEGPTPVALLITHDGPLVAAILGTIAAGNVVVVADPMAPHEVTAHVLASSGATLLVCDEANRALAESHAVPTEDLDSLLGGGVANAFVPPSRSADSPVMLAFTSGTTGESKAAIITNGVILNLVRGASNALGLGPDDRMPMLFPTSLAVAAYPMFLPLLNGGTLATLDVRSVGLEPLGPFLESERITVAYMAPTVIRFCVDAFKPYTFPDLRLLALGGEVVDSEIVQLSHQLMTPTLMANGFGTTETGVITLYVIDPSEEFSGIVPAGYPVADVELVIVDEAGREVQAGESGEVAVRTPYAFDGYWGYPELSSSVLSEVEGHPGWRLYRTGDLGRIDEHGALFVLGRVDTKVKVRGRFVVLGDVESSICDMADVRDAVVLSEVVGGNNSLVAHVTLEPDSTATEASLRSGLLDRLEAFRVPARWVIHDALPQLPNGKTDRRALVGVGAEAVDTGEAGETGDAAGLEDEAVVAAVEPVGDLVDDPVDDAIDHPVDDVVAEDTAGGEHATRSSAGAEPETPTEKALYDLWWELLPMNPTGVDDEFTALGGDSLLAAQMLVLVEHRLGVLIPMGSLLDAKTIRQLAAKVDAEEPSRPNRDTAVCVNNGRPGKPILWFVPDLQGSAYRVRHLAEAIGDDQPIWSFESPFIKGEPNPFRSLDTFVSRLLVDLRAVQPHGPYYLAGYSFGGICAYEMALQLTAGGEQVAFCGVVDVGPGYRGPGWGDHSAPPRPWFGVAKPPDPSLSLADKANYYRDMAKVSPGRLARHLMVRAGVAERVDPLRFAADIRRHGRVRPEWRLWYAWNEHWKLSATAWDRSKPYHGRVDLFWASDTPSADNSQGWGSLVDDLVIHRFNGDHDSLLEPRGVAPLAQVLRSCLDELG